MHFSVVYRLRRYLMAIGVPPLGGVKQGRCGENKLFSS